VLRRLLVIPALLVVLVLALEACGEDDGVVEGRIPGDTLTVYSSLPQRGPLGAVSRDLVAAQKLALLDAGGRAGRWNVNFVSLDSADPETGRWDPGQVAANARRAVQDRFAIAYLGELEGGASAISLPILNEGGILQVSPRDTFGGLTDRGGRGEPEKYYPSGRRTFARLVPGDAAQADELLDRMRSDAVRRLVVVDDRQLSGMSLGDRVARRAQAAGIELVERRRLDSGGEVPEGLGREIGELRADAVLFAGEYGDLALGVLQAVHAADPDVRLYGTDDLAIAPALPGRVGAAARRLQLTGVEAEPDAARARAFARRFEAVYGRRPDPQAILGHRAMGLVLRAIEQAGEDAGSRREVIDRALALAGEPRAVIARYRVQGNRLVRVGPPM
jgi:branched-chain amino acid transport system substrate-binding protein